MPKGQDLMIFSLRQATEESQFRPRHISNGVPIFDGGPFNGGQIIPGGVIPNGAVGTGLPTISAPSFDPYRTPNQTFPIFPRATQAVLPQTNVQPNFAPLPQAQFSQPALPRFNPPQYNSQFSQIPNRWPYQGTGSKWNWPRDTWDSFRTQFLPRVLERPRITQTYLHGNNGNELNINDLEIATTATSPNFLRGNQPLRISPGFIFHWWDGPGSTFTPGFDLPSRAYSAYLSFDHMTDPRRDAGLEGNFTVGYYSDFENTSSDAIRLTSKFLGWRRLNPYTIAKIGVEYFDRVDVKLLPAVGLYMTPNADIKLDLYFPKTKLAHRVPNLGNNEVWAYVGAEYGGGSWAIERPRRVTGFVEFGYAFEREIVFRSNALNALDLQDTLLLRSGIAF